MRHLVLALCVVTVIVPSTEAAPTQTARAFMVETTWQGLRGQYGRVWAKVHPRYQRVTTRERWEACQRALARRAAGWEWLSVRATGSTTSMRRFPLLGRIRSTTVTIQVQGRHPALGVRTLTETIPATRVKGSWKGLWRPDQYRAYRAGRCPT